MERALRFLGEDLSSSLAKHDNRSLVSCAVRGKKNCDSTLTLNGQGYVHAQKSSLMQYWAFPLELRTTPETFRQDLKAFLFRLAFQQPI